MTTPERPRVLVVEDRPGVLKILSAILETGYQVSAARSGGDALALLESRAFDVVLTDVRMPGLSGFEVLRAVRNRSPACSVVMMTAYANIADAVAAIKLGAYDYVAKPVDADELALVVARAVDHQRGAARDPADAPLGEVAVADDGAGSAELLVGFRSAVGAARQAASRRYLVALMHAFQGNVTRAAIRAGMSRVSLHRLLKQYEVRSEHYKDRVKVG